MRIRKCRKGFVFLTVFMIGMGLGVCSYADFAQIDYSFTGETGNITFNGSALTTAGVQVSAITGINTPSNGGGNFLSTLPGTTTLLSLSDSNYTGANGGTGWSFGPGTISVTNSSSADGPLLQGSYTSLTILQEASLANGAFQFNLLFTNCTDTKDPNTVSYFGYPAGEQWLGNLNLVFDSSYLNPGGTFSVVVNSGEVQNAAATSGTTTDTVTPIPGAIWLFASGLAGIMGLKRKYLG